MTRRPGPLQRLFGLSAVLAALLLAPSTPAQTAEDVETRGAPEVDAFDGGLIHDPNLGQLVRFRFRATEPIWTVDFDLFSDASAAAIDFSDINSLGQPANSFSLNVDDLIYVHGMYSEITEQPDKIRFISASFDNDEIRLLFDQGVPLWGAIIATLVLLGLGGLIAGVVLASKQRRRDAQEAAERKRTFHAREAERSRLAREIHDGPLQDVHALRMLTGSGEPEAVDSEAARIARELRAIAEGLRPPALGRFGLSAALSAHANRVKDRYPSVSVKLDLDEDGNRSRALPDIVRSSLFRIVQESITNAVEHGGATRIEVRLSLPTVPGGDVAVTILDDGGGFGWTDSPDLEALADSGHFGLVGMHERAAAIGGTLELLPGGLGGRGATVRVSLPDPREQADLSDSRRHLVSA